MSTRASADRYARALLDVVAQEGNPEQVQQELTNFAELFVGSELHEVLTSPAVPAASKRCIVESLITRMTLAVLWEAAPAGDQRRLAHGCCAQRTADGVATGRPRRGFMAARSRRATLRTERRLSEVTVEAYDDDSRRSGLIGAHGLTMA
jgi:hypothetical protein